MTIDMRDIETLAARLTTPGPAALSDSERTLALGALLQLASEAALVAKQSRLLRAHDDSGERVDALLAGALRDLGDSLGRPSPAEGYDFDAAKRAREDLAEAVRDARTGRQVIAAALVFAREIVGLL